MALISLINYLVIAQSGTVIDIAKDFTALMIIADFDDIFGGGMDKEIAKIVCLDEDDIYEKIFMIETTTSNDAEGEQDEEICKDPGISHVINSVNSYRRLGNVSKTYHFNEELGIYDGTWTACIEDVDKKKFIKRPRTIRLYWNDRIPSNKFLYAIYKVLRILHVTVWFY